MRQLIRKLMASLMIVAGIDMLYHASKSKLVATFQDNMLAPATGDITSFDSDRPVVVAPPDNRTLSQKPPNVFSAERLPRETTRPWPMSELEVPTVVSPTWRNNDELKRILIDVSEPLPNMPAEVPGSGVIGGSGEILGFYTSRRLRVSNPTSRHGRMR